MLLGFRFRGVRKVAAPSVPNAHLIAPAPEYGVNSLTQVSTVYAFGPAWPTPYFLVAGLANGNCRLSNTILNADLSGFWENQNSPVGNDASEREREQTGIYPRTFRSYVANCEFI